MKKHTLFKRWWNDLNRTLFINHLNKTDLDCGQITIKIQGEDPQTFKGKQIGPKAYIHILDSNFFPMITLQGDIGLGDAYMENYYITDNLVELISFFILNPSIRGSGDGIIPSLQRAKDYIQHLMRDNRIAQGKKNIESHYDIGNDFYQTFLDKSLMYSSAIFSKATQSLEEAQYNKLDVLIEKTKISENDHVLEIGSGWGAFALRAAETRGCKVTTITLSEEQFSYVSQKIIEKNLQDKVEIKLIDYRKMSGKFNKIVSIEMIEAVGHRHLKSYAAALEKLLAPNGIITIQMISMPDYRYKQYTHSVDWIRKRIFPGGHLPSVTSFTAALAKWSQLHLETIENIAPHYAETLLRWHHNFTSNSLEIAKQKFGSKFIKMWEFYLLSCSAAFSTRYINTHILTLSRPCNLTLSGIDQKAEPTMNSIMHRNPVNKDSYYRYQ